MSVQISVLMPIGPKAQWLEEATASLIAQTHPDWMLVAVLDGDCEANRAILERPELQGRVRIEALRVQSGVAAALNAGLAKISTDLVARLDADDICEPQRLEVQIDELRERPDLVVLGSAATVIDGNGNRIGTRPVPVGARRVRRALLWRNSLIHPSAVFRRQAVVRAGGYNSRCVRGQDYELWLRLVRLGQLDNLAAPLVRYRIHGGQHSRPIVTKNETTVIRTARRKAAGASRKGAMAADARHATWLSHQLFQSWRTRSPLLNKRSD